MRVAPRAQRRVLTVALAVALTCLPLAGCARPDPADAIRVSWTLEPSPPVSGAPITARLTLRDAEQKPITGAQLRLEGLMSHPGMAPVTAAVTERGNGDYDAPIQFTMAGDWILLVTGQLPGGIAFTKQIEINGVRPSS